MCVRERVCVCGCVCVCMYVSVCVYVFVCFVGDMPVHVAVQENQIEVRVLSVCV